MRPHLKNKLTLFMASKISVYDQLTIAIDLVRQKGLIEQSAHLIAFKKQRQTGKGHTYPSKTSPQPGSVLPPTRHHLLIACSFSYELINGFTH